MEFLNLDFAKILSYGLSGLAAIFIIGAVVLIQMESKKPKPNANVLKTVRLFMWLSLISLLVVGIFPIPKIIQSNNQLDQSKNIADTAVIYLIKELTTITGNYNNLSNSYSQLLAENKRIMDLCNQPSPQPNPGPFIVPTEIDPGQLIKLKNMVETKNIPDSTLQLIYRKHTFLPSTQ